LSELAADREQAARLRRKTLSQQVSEYLLDRLRDGDLKPGDRLPTERQLMSELSVGRSCVREALHALVMMNLIDVRPGVGAIVRNPAEDSIPDWKVVHHSLEDLAVAEILEARIAIELAAVGLATRRSTPTDLNVIRAALAEHRRVRNAGPSAPALRRADLGFHEAIARGSHNSVLLSLVTSLTDAFEHLRAETLNRMGRTQDRVIDQHQEILRAIEARDVEAAQSALRQHLETGSRLMRKAESA